ncbi:MAG: DegT/DnrJ/EryC1/StrS family aminotransferase [Gammaproteobacteria bacterium]|nr:DegT/DnrJ/EryC1/StrS family aminotransferase [Gammaproteobacteria bacterium]
MNIPFAIPMIGQEERDAVREVLDGSILVHGPRATIFEQAFAEFTGAPHAVSVSSCTAGMHLIYFAMGYGPGDEVIVPAQTHVATAHAVELTGAKPVFVDSELETGNIDISKIEAAISSRTRAIVVVHYLGVPVDMRQVLAIAKRHNLFVLEDCALSLGAKVDGVHTGLQGDAGVFSFYPVKHITTAEGGMVILRDGELAKQLKLKKAFGVDRTHGERKVPGMYDVITLGFNYRMSEIHAAIGIEQVKKLPTFLTKRAENHQVLSEYLESTDGLRVLPAPMGRLTSCHYCLAIILDDGFASKRAQIMDLLTTQGIGSSVYYPQPVPHMSYYRNKYGYDDTQFPNAARLSRQSIALPVGPHLGSRDMKRIAGGIKKIMEEMTCSMSMS